MAIDVQISNAYGIWENPQALTRVPAGTLYAVPSLGGNTNPTSMPIWCSSDDGQTWSSDYTISQSRRYQNPGFTVIGSDSEGYVHIAWCAMSTVGSWTHYVSYLKGKVGAWGSIQDVYFHVLHSYTGSAVLSMAIDSSDNPHILFRERYSNNYYIKHIWYTGSAWTSETIPYGNMKWPSTGMFVFSSDNKLHLVIRQGDYGGSQYNKYGYKPNGGSWSAAEDITSTFPSSGSVSPYFCCDKDDYLHFCDTTTYRRKDPSGAWDLAAETHGYPLERQSTFVPRDSIVYIVGQYNGPGNEWRTYTHERSLAGSWSSTLFATWTSSVAHKGGCSALHSYFPVAATGNSACILISGYAFVDARAEVNYRYLSDTNFIVLPTVTTNPATAVR